MLQKMQNFPKGCRCRITCQQSIRDTESFTLLLSELCPEYYPDIRVCQKQFARFKSGNFDVKNKERLEQPKKFDEKLETLFDQNSCQMQHELAVLLNFD